MYRTTLPIRRSRSNLAVWLGVCGLIAMNLRLKRDALTLNSIFDTDAVRAISKCLLCEKRLLCAMGGLRLRQFPMPVLIATRDDISIIFFDIFVLDKDGKRVNLSSRSSYLLHRRSLAQFCKPTTKNTSKFGIVAPVGRICTILHAGWHA